MKRFIALLIALLTLTSCAGEADNTDITDIINTDYTETTEMNTTKEKSPDVGIWYSTWYAYTAEESGDNKINTWTAWDIPYRPLLPDGSYGMYDSLDEAVISFHLGLMSDAGIDFIIMDQTNNIDVDGGYINARSLKTAQICMDFIDANPDRRPVRYCSAIGGVQFSGDPASVENEARMLWERYDTSEKYHYQLEGKPLLVIYLGNIKASVWEDYDGDKTYASKFTIRYADNESRAGYYGWAFDKGTKIDGEASVVMPGWDNRKGATPVKRRAGKWYTKSLNVVLDAEVKPQIVVINSFNEYAEGTAVFTADTQLKSCSDPWKNADGEYENGMYWNMTVDFIKQLRAAG